MTEEIYKQACEHAQAGDYVEAAKCFKKAADAGHGKAQYNLAVCLHEGLGGYQAHMEAFHYFKKAAEKGHDRAHYMLGCYFAMGLAPYESKEEGIEHFRIAAEAGVAEAQYNYGVYLLEEKQAEEATTYFQKAMEQGNSDGAYNLGICYAKGLVLLPKNSLQCFQRESSRDLAVEKRAVLNNTARFSTAKSRGFDAKGLK